MIDYLIIILLFVIAVILFWLGLGRTTINTTKQWQEKIYKSNMKDYLIVHESDTNDYYLYLSTDGRKMSSYKFNEEEIVKLYNAIKKTLERENLI